MKKSDDSPCCKMNPPAWHAAFEAMIPVIKTHARIAFRHLPLEAREEAIQETICNACVAYARLEELGKTDVAHASVLATFSVRQTRVGRKVDGSDADVVQFFRKRRRELVQFLQRAVQTGEQLYFQV